VSDFDTEEVDSLKVLDPNRPIREATDAKWRPLCREAALLAALPAGLKGSGRQLPRCGVAAKSTESACGPFGFHVGTAADAPARLP
jgi:hypothetical protein